MKISHKDLVQLSAYLDGELNRKEIIMLEERIKVNPGFQAVLEELKITKEVLKSTPKLTVPRNFSLSRAQLGIKIRPPVYKRYRLAAALMSFVFLGILILDFGSISLGASFIPALAPKSQEILLESAADSALEEMEQPALMSAEADLEAGRASGEPEEVQSEDAAEAVEAAAEGLAEEEMAAAADAQADGESAPVVGAESPSEAKTTSDPASEERDAPAEQTDDQTQANLAAPSPTVEGVPQATLELTFADESTSLDLQQSRLSLFRILEIIFGLAMIVFGAAAWFLKRRESR